MASAASSAAPISLYFKNGLVTLGDTATFMPAPPGFAPSVDSMGCDYVPYDSDHPTETHLEIVEFLGRLFPDPQVNLYVMTLLASCLDQKARNQSMAFLWGPGGNGKTTFMDLVQATFGSTSTFIDSNVLTGETMFNDAMLEVIKEVAGKRVIAMEAIEPQYKINSVNFKSFLSEVGTGFYSCNAPPKFSEYNASIERRIIVVPFESRFVLHESRVNPEKHVYLRDPTIHEKVKSPQWISHFAGMLVYYYQNYVKAGLLSIPAESAEFGALKKAKEAFTAAESFTAAMRSTC